MGTQKEKENNDRKDIKEGCKGLDEEKDVEIRCIQNGHENGIPNSKGRNKMGKIKACGWRERSHKRATLSTKWLQEDSKQSSKEKARFDESLSFNRDLQESTSI